MVLRTIVAILFLAVHLGAVLSGPLAWGASSSSSLTHAQKKEIYRKLSELPETRDNLFRFLFPENGEAVFSPPLQRELEGLLKASLLDTDTQVNGLTPEIRQELQLQRGVAAFHKQTGLPFEIQAGSDSPLLNEHIRKLQSPKLFGHAHNVFVHDRSITQDNNPVILLFHELSHAAFDRWVEKYPAELERHLRSELPAEQVSTLFVKNSRGKSRLDADTYDLLSERYAFELEYRINWEANQKLGKKTWPFFYRFAQTKPQFFRTEIDEFVRRSYAIRRAELKNFRSEPTEKIVHALWQKERPETEWKPISSPAPLVDCDSFFARLLKSFK
jgi:hypothetical protein